MSDQGATAQTAADRINAKIENRIAKRDFLSSLESAYIMRQTTINTPVIKRVYLRFFDPTQLNMHIISVYGRVGLTEEQVVQVENAVRKSLDDTDAYLNERLHECDALFTANGISATARHLAPKQFEVRVISPLSNKYLKLLVKADQLIGMIEVLVIEDILKTTRGEMLIAEIRNRLRKVATGTRSLALGVRRMVQAQQQNSSAAAASIAPTNGSAVSTQPAEAQVPDAATQPPAPDAATAALAIARAERRAASRSRRAAPVEPKTQGVEQAAAAE